MPRSALAQFVRQLASVNAEAHRRGVDLERVIDQRRQKALTRRRFLGTAAKASLLTALGGANGFVRPAAAGASASIAIVGGGLAGLTCAWRLRRAGLRATIYEASGHLGGRCQTRRNYFEDGQIAERGGELIDTGHVALQRLAGELGLLLDDLLAAEPPGTEPFYYFQGKSYSFDEATRDFQQIDRALRADVTAAGYPTLYNHYTPRGRELDRTSIVDYLSQIVPGGVNSPLGQLLDVAYNIEYGAETNEQSALNLLYLLGFSPKQKFQIFGDSDERFHLHGGNDQLVSGLAEKLPGQIELGAELRAVVRNADGRFKLVLRQDAATREVVADTVVLALPFSILRHSVDLSRAGFSALKLTAIDQLGMGTNSKLQLQFTNRRWNELGCTGDSYADTGYQNTWDVTRAQAGQSGIMVDYTGGKIGAGMNHGTVQERAQLFLSQIEPVLPGLGASYNGKAALEYWTGYPWTRGSYSYWKVGQYTGFAGIEGAPEGNCHFCGEHTSIDFQGFMNGAIDTGERAAREIAQDLGAFPPAAF